MSDQEPSKRVDSLLGLLVGEVDQNYSTCWVITGYKKKKGDDLPEERPELESIPFEDLPEFRPEFFPCGLGSWLFSRALCRGVTLTETKDGHGSHKPSNAHTPRRNVSLWILPPP